MAGPDRPKKTWLIVLIIIFFGFLFTLYFRENLTSKFLGGRTFSGRNLQIKIGIFFVYWIIITTITYLLYRFTQKHLRKIHRLPDVFLAIFLLSLLIIIINIQSKIILWPYQLEYREGASQTYTQAILEGKKLFSLESEPLYNNNYGILYNIIVAPLALIFGNTLQIHRIVSIFFIFLSSSLIVGVLQKEKVHLLFALAGGLLFWTTQLYSVIPIARPDSFGTLVFLCAIFLPWFFNYSTITLVTSVLLGCLAFLVKPYFVICIPYITLYLFLFISKRKGVQYAVISTVLLCAMIVSVNSITETYFYDVVYINSQAPTDNIRYSLNQLGKFSLDYSGIIILAVALLCMRFYPNISNLGKRNAISSLRLNSLTDLSQPLFSVRLNLAVFCFSLSLLLIYFKLGRHMGANMTYLFELMSPFLIVMIFPLFKENYIPDLLIIPFIMINLFHFMDVNVLSCWKNSDMSNWRMVETYIHQGSQILNSPAITSILINQNKPVVDSGQSEYFYYPPLPEKIFYFLPSPDELSKRRHEYKTSIIDAVTDEEFDYVILTKNWPAFIKLSALKKNYRLIETIEVYMPQTCQTWKQEIWKPKHAR